MLKKYGPIILAVFFFSGLVLIWEIVARSNDHLLLVLPPPTTIIPVLFGSYELYFLHTFETAKEMFAGLIFAIFLSFPFVYLKVHYKTMRYIFKPLFVLTQCLPMFTLAPLMIFWFGWSKIAVIVPTTIMIFFPLTYSLYQGILATPQSLVNSFVLHKATPWQVFWKLRLPYALPDFFSGLKISCIISGIGAVAGEWAGAQEGLGMLMIEMRRGAHLAGCFAALLCLLALTSSFYAAAYLLEYVYKIKGLTKKRIFIVAVVGIFFLSFLNLMSFYKEEGVVRLSLDWLPNPNHVPIYVGVEKGFFKERGINLSVLKVKDPADPLPLLQLEKCEVALTYMPRYVRAKHKGASLKPVAILIKEPLDCLMFKKGLNIKKVDELSDCTFTYCMDGSGGGFLNALLGQNNVVPYQSRHADFDLVGILAQGMTDVISGVYYTIEKEHLNSLGIEVDYFTFKDLGAPNYYELMFVLKENGMIDTESFIKNFQIALEKSIQFCLTDPDQAFKLFADVQIYQDEISLEWQKKAFLTTLPLYAENQILDKNVLFNLEAWLEEKGLI